MSTIITRNSATSGSTPSSLVQGELAINVTDGRLFYGSGSGNVVKEFTGSASGGGTINTGSFVTTSSFNAYTGSNTSQFAGTASYATTASYVLNAVSSSFAATASYLSGTIASASYAITASYVQNAQSASYVLNAVSSSYALSASYATTASYAITSSYGLNPTISGSINNVDYIDFNTGSAIPAWKSGRIFWDNTDGALSVYNAEQDITLQIGQENWTRVWNPLTSSILNGQPVRITGTHGDHPEVALAQSSAISGSANLVNQILGVATHTIEPNSFGYITTQGLVRGLNTNAYSDGDTLYVSQVAGQYINTQPSAPYEIIPVGQVVKASPGTSGIIYVAVQQPLDFSDLSSVRRTGIDYAVGDLWTYQPSSSFGVWVHGKQLTGSYGLTGSLTATSFTGSLFGTSSWANNAQTSQTASYVLNAVSASYSQTASYVNPLNQTVQITGSLQVQNSIDSTNRNLIDSVGNSSVNWNDRYLLSGSNDISLDWKDRKLYDSNDVNSIHWNSRQLFKSDGTTVTLNWETGVFTGSMLGTASYAIQTLSSSYAITASYYGGSVVSASYALTASYVQNAQTASYVQNAQTASYVLQAISASYAALSQTANTASYVVTSQTASYVLNAVSSSYASSALSASYATTSSYSNNSTSASYAINATTSQTASYVLNAISASYATQALSSSFSSTASYYGGSVVSASYAQTASYVQNAQTASYVTLAQTSSYVLNAVSASYATTASYYGGSVVSASYAATASYVGPTLTQNLTLNGNFTVNGTASYTYVTASQLDVGTNFISVNVGEPAERFGGLLVYDSGSISHQATASLAWDSLNNHWVYQNASGSTYSGGMLLAGPRNTGSLGDEPSLTRWFIARSDGGDHLNNTQIYSSASIHIVTGSLTVTEGITGSLLGTSSYAVQSLSASYAPPSNPFPYVGNAAITGSLEISGSFITYDESNIKAIQANLSKRSLFDASAVVSVNWSGRGLYSPSSFLSLDWSDNNYLDSNVYQRDYKSATTQNAVSNTINNAYSSYLGDIIEVDGTNTFIDGTVNDGMLVYLDTDATWYPVTQNSTTATKMVGIACNVAANTGFILLEGHVVIDDSGTNRPTVTGADHGLPVYIEDNTTNGRMSTTMPTTTGGNHVIRVLGHCYWQNTGTSSQWMMKFRPSNDWITI